MKRILLVLMIVTVMISSLIPISANATSNIPKESNPEIFEYEGQEYIVPQLSINREARVTECGYVEKYTEVPHFFQTFYPKTKYGNSSVRQGGCGITCVSMVLTYLLDEEVGIEELAKKYYTYKVADGSSYNLFYDSAEDYGVTVSKAIYDWETVLTALKDGKVVIANPKAPSLFTTGGHFIVLAGLTEDGKIIVKDPNLYNYGVQNYEVRQDGYANGFNEENIKYSCLPCFIYEEKDWEKIAKRVEIDNINCGVVEEEIS